MAIQASKPVNDMLFVLIGERLMQANEDLAHASHEPFRRLAKDVRDLSDVIEQSVVSTGKALPPQVGNDYVRAMSLFVDEEGAGYLKQFGGKLDEIADGRMVTSYKILEGKWQIIAEVIRLLIELVILTALSVFSSGATAGKIALAKARRRVTVLTILDTLIRSTDRLPFLTEAFEEAFQTFAVRLGMIAFTSGAHSPKSFDWKEIGESALFGALAGTFFGAIHSTGQGILGAFKNDLKNTPFVKNVADDVTPKVGAKTNLTDTNKLPRTADTTHADDVTAGNRNTDHLPETGAVPSVKELGPSPAPARTGHKGSDIALIALAAAGSETLAEVVGGGILRGEWTVTFDTFLGAGLSAVSEAALGAGALGAGALLKEKFSLKASDLPAVQTVSVDPQETKTGADAVDEQGSRRGTHTTVSGGDGPGAVAEGAEPASSGQTPTPVALSLSGPGVGDTSGHETNGLAGLGRPNTVSTLPGDQSVAASQGTAPVATTSDARPHSSGDSGRTASPEHSGHSLTGTSGRPAEVTAGGSSPDTGTGRALPVAENSGNAAEQAAPKTTETGEGTDAARTPAVTTAPAAAQPGHAGTVSQTSTVTTAPAAAQPGTAPASPQAAPVVAGPAPASPQAAPAVAQPGTAPASPQAAPAAAQPGTAPASPQAAPAAAQPGTAPASPQAAPAVAGPAAVTTAPAPAPTAAQPGTAPARAAHAGTAQTEAVAATPDTASRSVRTVSGGPTAGESRPETGDVAADGQLVEPVRTVDVSPVVLAQGAEPSSAPGETVSRSETASAKTADESVAAPGHSAGQVVDPGRPAKQAPPSPGRIPGAVQPGPAPASHAGTGAAQPGPATASPAGTVPQGPAATTAPGAASRSVRTTSDDPVANDGRPETGDPAVITDPAASVPDRPTHESSVPPGRITTVSDSGRGSMDTTSGESIEEPAVTSARGFDGAPGSTRSAADDATPRQDSSETGGAAMGALPAGQLHDASGETGPAAYAHDALSVPAGAESLADEQRSAAEKRRLYEPDRESVDGASPSSESSSPSPSSADSPRSGPPTQSPHESSSREQRGQSHAPVGAFRSLMRAMAQAADSVRSVPERGLEDGVEDGVREGDTRAEEQDAASGSDTEDIVGVPGERPRPQGEVTDTNHTDTLDGGELETPPAQPSGWPLAGADMIWRGEVKPPQELMDWPQDSKERSAALRRRWNHEEEKRKLVPRWDGYMAPLELRRFEARRYRLPSGEFGTRLVVRIRLAPADGSPVTEEQLSQLFQSAQDGVNERYNAGSRLPNGDLFRVDLKLVSDPDAAHHVVRVHSSGEQVNFENWPLNSPSHVLAHELGHLLGLDDEYREGHAFGARPVYLDGALMAGPAVVDSRGRSDVDADHRISDPRGGSGRWWLPPRHLRQFGAAVESLQGAASLRVDGGAAFYADDTLSRTDGLPTRAHFPEDIRRAVLYGEPGVGGGGHLPPSGMSGRARPVALGEVGPNGTYRGEYKDLAPGREPGGLSRPVAPTDRLHSAAGDLHVTQPKQPKRGQMMFPAYWTEDDVVYAAEQAYLHALREHDMLTQTPREHPLSEKKPPIVGERGVYTWEGEYAGVRIKGELSHGSFTGFRPSDDQPDQPAPPYAPAPDIKADSGIGRRVEDMARYGDRHTRRGAHHALEPRQATYHGVHVEPGEEYDNGTFQASVRFLDPALRYDDPQGDDPSRWHLHRDGAEHVMFPRTWEPRVVLDAVEHAHHAAIAAGTYRELPDRDRSRHWVGEVGGVRIEGLVRDGQHVAYRPTQTQPHLRWPQERPTGETAAVPVEFERDGRQCGFDVRRVLFADGQQGLGLTARIHLAAQPGTTPAVMDLVWDYLAAEADLVYGGSTRGYGTPQVRLARVEGSQPAHHVVPVDLTPEETNLENMRRIVDGLPNLLGLPTSPDALMDVARQLDQTTSAEEWLLPRGAHPVEGQAAIDQALSLQVEPHRGWPQERPIGEMAAVPVEFERDGRQCGFDVQHVLLANGQRGFDLSARIYLDADPDTEPARLSELWGRMQAAVADVYGGVARANGAPLVRVSLARVEDHEAAHHAVWVLPDPETDWETVSELPLLLGIQPDTGDFRDFAEGMGGLFTEADAWEVPQDADPVRGAEAIANALDLADPFSRPTTLREPDPAGLDDSPTGAGVSSAATGTTSAAAGVAPGDGGQSGADVGAAVAEGTDLPQAPPPEVAFVAAGPAPLSGTTPADPADPLDEVTAGDAAADPQQAPAAEPEPADPGPAAPDEEHRISARSQSPAESEEGPGEGATVAPRAPERKTAFARIESELDLHRPPRVDRSMPSPSPEEGPVTFSDGSRLPEYLTTGYGTGDAEGRTYGHSQVTLRGVDVVMREIGVRLGDARSATPGMGEALAHLQRALRATPQVFHGDGYESPAFGSPQEQVLRVTTRPYGNWERFTDIGSDPVKVDVAHRSQVTAGAVESVSMKRRGAAGVALGPGVAGLVSLGGTVGVTRSYDYGMQDQTLGQVETRMAEASHLHLDDLVYEVSLAGDPGRTSPARQDGSPLAGESTFTFAVRNGLVVRLADSETSATEPGPVPIRMTLGAQSDYRLVHTEGYGPLRPMRDEILRELGAEPGSEAHEYLTAFFSSENFNRAADRLAKGGVTTPLLSGEDGSPLGAFVVERVVPGEAELLTESQVAEMRLTVQQTVKNERTLSRTTNWGINFTGGPTFDFAPWGRLITGASVGYESSTTHSSAFGGSGSRKIVGRAKNVPTLLYRVDKAVYVRGTGSSEAVRFDTWSLDRMTHTEARRLAGWDDGTTLRKRNDNEPFAPVYLTKDRPAVLGMSRPEAFTYENGDLLAGEEGGQRTWLEAFTDKLIRAAADRYPGVLAPLEDFGDPEDSRWRGPKHYAMALRNTLHVMNALSHYSIVGNLETLTTTGLSIGLEVPPTRTRRSQLSIRIGGELTGRRYDGTQNDLLLRTSAPGTERLDGSQNVTHAQDAGFGVMLRGIGGIGTVSAGPRWGRTEGRGTQYGATATHEPLAASARPSHLHSYQLELTAEIGGFSRYRRGPRALSLGVLGMQSFLQDEVSTDLVGGSAGAAVVGRVVLAVPDEHTPATDPHTGAADRAKPLEEPLDRAQAEALVTRDLRVASEGHGRHVFGDQPFQTVSVGSSAELAAAAVDLMAEASRGSWHFSKTGALPHDVMMRRLQAQFLIAGSDQTFSAAGSRISVIAEGALRNRVGELVLRMRVLNPVVVSGPVKIGTEVAVGSDTQMSGSVTAAKTFGLAALAGGAGVWHAGGVELTTFSGLVYRRGSSSTEARSVTRTVTSDINRDDGGYKVLVSGDVQHDLVGSVRPDGLLRPVLSPFYRNSWAGKQLTFASNYLGHLSEKSAHQLGLIKDGLGGVPLYLDNKWTQPPSLREHQIASYPVNSLDTTGVLAEFDQQLRDWKVDEADRERVHSLVTPRAVRALREQMTSTGAGARTRVGRWRAMGIRVGSRVGALRVELIAEEPEFAGLGHGVVLEDTRSTSVTEAEGKSAVSSRAAGLSLAQGVGETQPPDAKSQPGDLQAVHGTYEGLITSAEVDSRSRSRTRTRRHIFSAKEPHAEYLTRYTLRLTLEFGNGRTPLTAAGGVGTLREQVPLSMTAPDTGVGRADDPLGPPSVDDSDGSVTVWAQGSATRPAIDEWRSVPQPNGTEKPFQQPSTGFQVRRIVGLDRLKEAGVLAIAKAYGASVAPAVGDPRKLTATELDEAMTKARRNGLTRPGTASALALDDGTSHAALAAFFEDTGTADGYMIPGLNEAGSAHGEYRLYSKPDFTRATLLTVVTDSTMESAERDTAAQDSAVSSTSGYDSALGVRPVVAAGDFGAAAPYASVTGPNAAETDRHVRSGAEGAQLNNKPSGRSFVFAIPTGWLGVAEVDRPKNKWLGPFGYIKPGQQAVEAQGQIIAVVREDVAREWGLIDDGNFPSRVADAWTQVVKAGQAWAAADDAYWDRRRALADLHERTPELTDSDLVKMLKRETLKPLLQRADAAAGEFHRVRAEADRLTRWHRLPAEDRSGEPELRRGLTEPPPVVFAPAAPTAPAGDSRGAEADHYIVRESAPGGPDQLLSPEGDQSYTVLDVPTDGDGFFHALAEGLHHADPEMLSRRVEVADRQMIIDGLRGLLADELNRPENTDLLDFTSPDTKDAFSGSELADSGVSFAEGTPERREFDGSGRIPLHAELPGEQRGRLAGAQLQRGGDTADSAGWNHGAADLLPALAARAFHARITVVGADGAFQDFRPLPKAGHDTGKELAHIVLQLQDRHYRPALPSGDARRQPPLPLAAEGESAPAVGGETPVGRPPRPAYREAPWATGSTAWRPAGTGGKLTELVGPDGTVHELVEPAGDGNGFWSAVAAALRLEGAAGPLALATGQQLPPAARLDRGSPFTDDDLVHAGLSEETVRSARLRRTDGGLPEDLELSRSQEEALIRRQLLTPRRWDDTTEAAAAELAAAYGASVTVVAEDGTSRTHTPSDGTAGPRVILYRRGREYLLARPTAAVGPAVRADVAPAATADVTPPATTDIAPAATADVTPPATTDIAPAATADRTSAAQADAGISPSAEEPAPADPDVRRPSDSAARPETGDGHDSAPGRVDGTDDSADTSGGAARKRTSNETAAEQDFDTGLHVLLDSQDVMDTLVRSPDVEGLSYAREYAAMWALAPDAAVPLKDLGLNLHDREMLLRNRRELFPEAVRDSFTRLTAHESAGAAGEPEESRRGVLPAGAESGAQADPQRFEDAVPSSGEHGAAQDPEDEKQPAEESGGAPG
ncbi:EndoU domain-containing protein [Streptomyces atratus]|uniref:Tfp pilus assembly protein FimV n=1 Tax=Streptomyces atratus TaxID=1893 RepID=A0A1K2F7A0_STRAR|nr:EndoU domain-containing protein [Streptomyces atratus]SFY43040.1 Tfp pilus assembly protein FimV [Streptomyces atratus]